MDTGREPQDIANLKKFFMNKKVQPDFKEKLKKNPRYFNMLIFYTFASLSENKLDVYKALQKTESEFAYLGRLQVLGANDNFVLVKLKFHHESCEFKIPRKSLPDVALKFTEMEDKEEKGELRIEENRVLEEERKRDEERKRSQEEERKRDEEKQKKEHIEWAESMRPFQEEAAKKRQEEEQLRQAETAASRSKIREQEEAQREKEKKQAEEKISSDQKAQQDRMESIQYKINLLLQSNKEAVLEIIKLLSPRSNKIIFHDGTNPPPTFDVSKAKDFKTFDDKVKSIKEYKSIDMQSTKDSLSITVLSPSTLVVFEINSFLESGEINPRLQWIDNSLTQMISRETFDILTKENFGNFLKHEGIENFTDDMIEIFWGILEGKFGKGEIPQKGFIEYCKNEDCALPSTIKDHWNPKKPELRQVDQTYNIPQPSQVGIFHPGSSQPETFDDLREENFARFITKNNIIKLKDGSMFKPETIQDTWNKLAGELGDEFSQDDLIAYVKSGEECELTEDMKNALVRWKELKTFDILTKENFGKFLTKNNIKADDGKELDDFMINTFWEKLEGELGNEIPQDLFIEYCRNEDCLLPTTIKGHWNSKKPEPH